MMHHAMFVMLDAINSALWNFISWPELFLFHLGPRHIHL